MAPLEDGQFRLFLYLEFETCDFDLRVTALLTLAFPSRLTDLEWKLTYVGSAESESFDQELDTCMVGPVPVGINSFEFEVSPYSSSTALCHCAPELLDQPLQSIEWG